MVDMVNHPPHYNQYKYECQRFRDYMSGPLSDAFKYLWRFQDKAKPMEDLQKSHWYTVRGSSNKVDAIIHPQAGCLLLEMLAEMEFPYVEQKEALTHILEAQCGMNTWRYHTANIEKLIKTLIEKVGQE